MNILYIITKSEIGGAQKFVYEQILLLANDEKYNLFLATNKSGWLVEKILELIDDKNILLSNSIEKGLSTFFLYQLSRFLIVHKIDLIVSSSANAGLYGRLAGFLTLKKTIYVSHGWSSIYNGGRFIMFYNFAERVLSMISSSIWCISEMDKIKAIQIIKISPHKIKVLTNSVYPPPSIVNSDCQGYDGDFVSVCRLSNPKRIDLLLEAMSLLPNNSLHIFGDGPQRAYLMQLSASKQLKNVFFKGEIAGFSGYKKYRVFCLISDSEGLPISALEAISHGMPIVLSNVGGCNEIISNNGFLVNNSPPEIANSLQKCLENQQVYGYESKKLFNEKYNLARNIDLIKNYFDKVLE